LLLLFVDRVICADFFWFVYFFLLFGLVEQRENVRDVLYRMELFLLAFFFFFLQ